MMFLSLFIYLFTPTEENTQVLLKSLVNQQRSFSGKRLSELLTVGVKSTVSGWEHSPQDWTRKASGVWSPFEGSIICTYLVHVSGEQRHTGVCLLPDTLTPISTYLSVSAGGYCRLFQWLH